MDITVHSHPVTNKCWFCPITEMPTALHCSHCGGVVLPSRDGFGKELDWMVYTFGNQVPAAHRFPDSVFPGALEDFQRRHGIAIRVTHRGREYLLARYPLSVPASKICHRSSLPNTPVMKTSSWYDVPPEEKTSFHSCLDEGMSSWFLIFCSVPLLTIRAGHPSNGYLWSGYVTYLPWDFCAWLP
mgnify:CR=1 FL=1